MHNLRQCLFALGCALVALVPAATGMAQTNTATDASGGDFVTCNGRVGFRTSEQLQNQIDLNGDLDANDKVVQILALGSGIIDNVGVDASGILTCGGNLFAFGASEFSEGNDLNGEGVGDARRLQRARSAPRTATSCRRPCCASRASG